MLRYCPNCKKDFDFSPLLVSGKSDILCPQCGGVIQKDSRQPVDTTTTDKMEIAIGSIFFKLMQMSFYFYVVVAIVGIAGYFVNYKILYISCAVSLLTVVFQAITGTLLFRSAIIFLPIGAAAGYYLKGINGAALAVQIVFLLRHLIRDVFYTLLWKFIKFCSK